MAKLDTAKVQKTFAELTKAINQQGVIDAIERAGKNHKLLLQAKKDPKKFLVGEGIRLPPRAEVTISTERISVGVFRFCITICRRVGPVIVCVRICKRIIVIVLG